MSNERTSAEVAHDLISVARSASMVLVTVGVHAGALHDFVGDREATADALHSCALLLEKAATAVERASRELR